MRRSTITRRRAERPRSASRVVVAVVVAAAALRPLLERPARTARRRPLGDDLRRDRGAGDAVPRARHRRQRGDRGVRPGRAAPAAAARTGRCSRSRARPSPAPRCPAASAARFRSRGRLVSRGVPAGRGADVPALGAGDQPGRAGRRPRSRFPGSPRWCSRGSPRACSPRPSWAWSGRASDATTCSTACAGGTCTRDARSRVFAATAQHDLLQAGGFLIIGAATAATLQTVVPRERPRHASPAPGSSRSSRSPPSPC